MFFHKVLRRKRRSFQGNPSVVGLTFLEIVISLSLIGVGMLGFWQILITALDAHSRSIREIISTTLAQGLMSEIMSKDFVEPGTLPPPAIQPPLGPDGTESGRSNFDDVDDFLGYTENPGPPRTVGNLPMNGTAGTPNYAGFFRTVTGVIYVDCGTTCTSTTCPPNCDYKQVTVRVTDPRGRFTEWVEIKARP